eukprot:12904835-Prorocentrum_lima.AAC.1
MLDGIHALARLDDALSVFEYASVQVSVFDGMIPHRDAHKLGPKWGTCKEDCYGYMGGVQTGTNTSTIHSN